MSINYLAAEGPSQNLKNMTSEIVLGGHKTILQQISSKSLEEQIFRELGSPRPPPYWWGQSSHFSEFRKSDLRFGFRKSKN